MKRQVCTEDSEQLALEALIKNGVFLDEEKLKTVKVQNLLGEIVLMTESYFTAEKAMAKLFDEKVLAKVATGAKRYKIKFLAIEKIEDQDLLFRVIIDSWDDYYAQLKAVRKITRKDLLEALVLKPKCSSIVRRNIVDRLESEEVLKRVVAEDENDLIRISAKERLEKITNENY